MAKRKNNNFDFSSLDFSLDFSLFGNQSEERDEAAEFIKTAKISLLPAAWENAVDMAEQMDLTQDYFCFVSGKFIFGDFIEALCHVHGLQPDAVYLTTLGMGQNNIDSIVNLVDYLGTKKVNLIVSNYWVSVERAKQVPYMIEEFSGKPIDVAVLASHCKICLIDSPVCKLIFAGSANLSSSNNVEQFQILHDPALFEWLRGRLDDVMSRWTILHGETGETIFGNNKGNLSRYAYTTMGDVEQWQGERHGAEALPDGTEAAAGAPAQGRGAEPSTA